MLPGQQGLGIGRELVRRMMAKLNDFCAVDVVPDADVMPFYERFGLRPGNAMTLRRQEALDSL